MKTKRFLSILLSLVLVLGMLPGMSLTAFADNNTTTITPGTDDAKTGSGTMTITLKIKAAQTITASDVTATYGDTDKSISASVTTPSTGGGTISYAVKEGSGDYISVASNGKLTIKKVPPTDGKAYVIVTAAATDDYAETTKEVTVTISKAEVTVTALNQSIMVGGTVPDLSAPVLDTHYSVTGLVGTDTLTNAPTLAYQKDGSAATPDSAAAGTYDIVPSGAAASDNYSISYTNATLTISDKGTQTITAETVTVTYGDMDKNVTATTNGNGAISYAVKDGSGDYIDVNETTGALTIKKVGTATVIVTAAETSTYAQATKEVTVTISKANAVAATVTANNRTYDGTEKPLVTVTGTPTGGTMQYALGTATEATEEYKASIPTATDAGTYYVWYKAVGDGDHTDSEAEVITVTIKEVHTHSIRLVEAKEPTCTEDGYKEHYECSECGAWFGDITGVSEITDKSGYTIKATGHDWGSYEVITRPTYDEEGLKIYTCKNDPSHTKEEIIPKLSGSSDSDSDTDNSDGSNMGSRDSRDSSSGKSSSASAEVQSMIDQINTTSSVAIPENHQVETGVAASDVGGNWDHQVNADTWTYTKSDGTLAKSEWMSLDYNGLRYWYYFNDDGNMRTNWFDYNNERFYLMPEKDGWRGRMATGWKNIENKWYYFETVPGSSQGRLYRSSVTPDGHTVGADGAWNGVGETPVGQK